MSQNNNTSSDLVMAMFGFIVIVVGGSAVHQSLDGVSNGLGWVLWIAVVAGGGMVFGVALNNILAEKGKAGAKKPEVAPKAKKEVAAKKPAKKKANG